MTFENNRKTEVPDTEPMVFETTLEPHCSLPPNGFAAIMIVIIAISAAISTGFSLLGAWPVIGFFGLDIILIAVAFRMGYRAARRREFVRLSESRLEILSLDESGHGRQTVMQPYWAKVELQHRPGGRLRLVVRSHARELELGSFLGPDEKTALADALADALRKLRNRVVGR